MMKLSGRVALAGIVCALSFIMMMLTVIPVTEIALPAIAGAILIFLVIELGVKWGFLGYAVVAILSLLMAPSMESRVLFVLFFGYYPVLKAILERISFPFLGWILKFSVFNITAVVGYIVLTDLLFAVDPAEFVLFGVFLPGVYLLVGNAIFFLYDIGLTRWISIYLHFWRPRLQKLFRF